jgi:imidazolonepropionase-like amidohydrolase
MHAGRSRNGTLAHPLPPPTGAADGRSPWLADNARVSLLHGSARVAAAVAAAVVGAGTASALQATAPRAVEPEPLAFVHVNVLPMDTERVLADQTVLVERGRIARIGPSSEVAIPAGTATVDGGGERFLMPGLCDSHVHLLDPDELPLYVANGVTAIRNMSGEPFHLHWRREIAEGRLEGPTLLTASPTIDGVPPGGTNRVIAVTREQGENAVLEAESAGYDCIKVYSGLPPEAHAGVVDAARRVGLKVVGHLPRALGLEAALAGGQDSIDHAEEYLYAFFASGGFGNDAEDLSRAVRLTREAGAWVAPNLVAFAAIGRQVADARALDAREELRYVDPLRRAQWLTESNRYLRDFSPDDAGRFEDQLTFLERLVRELHAAGVPLLAGTDAGVAFGVPFVLPGWSLHEELARLARCGLSPYEALATATVLPARFMGRAAEFGVVREGARADLLLLEGDPLADIGQAARPLGVVLRGRWLPREALAARLAALETLYQEEARFLELLEERGAVAAVERFREARAASPAARLFRERALNQAGYALLAAGSTQDAIAVFQLNAEAYPASADVYDSLGEGYAEAGDVPRAIECYERALSMNPWNDNAASRLSALRAR